jgi:hypothetical protein
MNTPKQPPQSPFFKGEAYYYPLGGKAIDTIAVIFMTKIKPVVK